MAERMQGGGWLKYSVRCPICADDARAVARRDAAWREAVERVREVPREFSGTAFDSGYNAALDALLAAMEGK